VLNVRRASARTTRHAAAAQLGRGNSSSEGRASRQSDALSGSAGTSWNLLATNSLTVNSTSVAPFNVAVAGTPNQPISTWPMPPRSM
jgi:hypothetical protein